MFYYNNVFHTHLLFFKIHHAVIYFMLFLLVKTYDTQFYHGILVRSMVHNKLVFQDQPLCCMFYVILVKTLSWYFVRSIVHNKHVFQDTLFFCMSYFILVRHMINNSIMIF